MKNIENIKPTKNALMAGFFYLALIIIGMYGFVYALPQIEIKGDIAKTVENIKNNSFMFRVGIFSILVMNVISILLVIYLYRLLSSINKTMGLSMLILMLFGAAISLVNEVNHFAMIVINGMSDLSATESQNLTDFFSTIHNHGAHIAVIFWGLWLFPLGILIFKLDTRISEFIGVMLVIAGIGYTLDSIFLFLYPNLQIPTLSDYTFLGEFLLTIWLLIKSRTIERLALSKI
ncbi:DUF4386 domain-containing protein [Aquimarina macrocephali]|uniref:DUF4386 domain-containing protein n=1 Tax=Aquimarina macrocephali TaxID=666563 RepID=UPI0004669EF3|nr:DUF4386 domain-containing protein [Aquimarina macrocephali]